MVFTSADPAFKPLRMPADESDEYRRHTLFGPRLDVVASPGRTIEGVIRDGETGRPVAGVSVRAWEADGQSTSDSQGRFRLTSQPIKKRHHIEVIADPRAYIKVIKVIDDPKGLEPIRTDITVRRGVTVEGRVTDRANGRPVKATVQYYPFRDNPNLGEYPDASFFDNALGDETEFRTDTDGGFQAVVLPGGGILAVRSPDPKYLTAAPLASGVAGNVLWISNFADDMHSYQALATINPPVGEKSVIPDITIAPARPQRVEVIGPDGKPVAGTRNLCLQQRRGDGEVVPGTEIVFLHQNPGKAERMVIYQENLGLGASIDIRGDEPDPIRVTLKPLAVVMGHVVDEDGQPRAGVPLGVAYRLKSRGEEIYLNPPRAWLTTDTQGRFRIEGLIPGIPCLIGAMNKSPTSEENAEEGYFKEVTLEPGESQAWGDVRVRRD
jgi:hypothetical protein